MTTDTPAVRPAMNFPLSDPERASAAWLIILTVSLLATCLLTGCSEAKPDYAVQLVPATGTVTLDGEPVDGAIVTFIAKTGASRSSTATTDASGAYVMETSEAGPGVLPGEYDVVISKMMQPDGSPVPPDTPPMDVGALEQLPNRYSSFAEPTLTAEVTTLGGTFDFELRGK